MKLSVVGHKRFRLNISTSKQKRLCGLIRFIIADELERLKPSVVISGGTLGFSYLTVDVARQMKIPYVMVLPLPQFLGKMARANAQAFP